MEVETGDIKAISNFGLTENGKYYEKLNYAIGEGIEPGSTFKLIAIAAALEDQVIDTIQKVDTSGGILDFYGYKVRDKQKRWLRKKLMLWMPSGYRLIQELLKLLTLFIIKNQKNLLIVFTILVLLKR